VNLQPAMRMQPRPWGWKRAMVGAGVGFTLFILTSVIVAIVIAIAGSEPITSDVGDAFEIAGRIARYTDERLAAIATGRDLPEPPRLKADITTVRIAFIVTPVYQVALIGAVIVISGRNIRQLIGDLRLHRFDFQTVWVAGVALGVTYIGVVLYASVMDAIGPDILVPESTVPSSVTRDPFALALTGVAAVCLAPISEELFYRGFLFGGLLRLGFWPSGAITAMLFSLTHFDPGSILPFFGIGMVLAWLAWRRGSLWDSIVLHFMFNGTSFALLLLTEV